MHCNSCRIESHRLKQDIQLCTYSVRVDPVVPRAPHPELVQLVAGPGQGLAREALQSGDPRHQAQVGLTRWWDLRLCVGLQGNLQVCKSPLNLKSPPVCKFSNMIQMLILYATTKILISNVNHYLMMNNNKNGSTTLISNDLMITNDNISGHTCECLPLSPPPGVSAWSCLSCICQRWWPAALLYQKWPPLNLQH